MLESPICADVKCATCHWANRLAGVGVNTASVTLCAGRLSDSCDGVRVAADGGSDWIALLAPLSRHRLALPIAAKVARFTCAARALVPLLISMSVRHPSDARCAA